ncbi:uncharacterized protein BDV17DRAFT_294086 [Aspergillus undulatus]|uniref:uncharacterized protein n=1 Tax=Aspergillus undulatus TaxID=1810928 RepID=UPI003CCC92B9
MESQKIQKNKSQEGRRRRTIFRKIRQYCEEFDIDAVIVLTDSANRQWIFKTADNVPAVYEAFNHPQTGTYDDFLLLRQTSAESRPDSRQSLERSSAPPVPKYRRVVE